jgi:hypothetical protein
MMAAISSFTRMAWRMAAIPASRCSPAEATSPWDRAPEAARMNDLHVAKKTLTVILPVRCLYFDRAISGHSYHCHTGRTFIVRIEPRKIESNPGRLFDQPAAIGHRLHPVLRRQCRSSFAHGRLYFRQNRGIRRRFLGWTLWSGICRQLAKLMDHTGTVAIDDVQSVFYICA